jgi:hypothetical protein
LIEKVTWGWYWIPDEVKDIWEFLRKDKNFEVISSQTAASFWNHDFIHRNIYIVKVNNKSYGKALEAFARSKGWNVEETIINCMQNLAFVDAFAVLYANRERIKPEKLAQKKLLEKDIRKAM